MAGAVDAESERWIERTDAYGWATGRISPALPPLQPTQTTDWVRGGVQ